MSDQATSRTVERDELETAIDNALNELKATREYTGKFATEKGPGKWFRLGASGQRTMVIGPGGRDTWASTRSSRSRVSSALTETDQQLIQSIANRQSRLSTVAGKGEIGDGVVRDRWLSKYQLYDPKTEMNARTRESDFITMVAQEWVLRCGEGAGENGNG